MTLGRWVTRSCPVPSPPLSPTRTARPPPTPRTSPPSASAQPWGPGFGWPQQGTATNILLCLASAVPTPETLPGPSSPWPAPPDPGLTSHCAGAAVDDGLAFPPTLPVSVYPFNAGYRAPLQGLGDRRRAKTVPVWGTCPPSVRSVHHTYVLRTRMYAWWPQGPDLSTLPVTGEQRGAAGGLPPAG